MPGVRCMSRAAPREPKTDPFTLLRGAGQDSHCHVLGTTTATALSHRAQGHEGMGCVLPAPHAHTLSCLTTGRGDPAATGLAGAGDEGEQQGQECIMGWISLSSTVGGDLIHFFKIMVSHL